MKNVIKPANVIKLLFVVVVIMANIGCDQVSKHIVREKIDAYQSIGFVYDHFTLTKVENTGAFFKPWRWYTQTHKVCVVKPVAANYNSGRYCIYYEKGCS